MIDYQALGVVLTEIRTKVVAVSPSVQLSLHRLIHNSPLDP